MLDHIGIAVADYARSKAFYEQALAPLGIAFMMEYPAGATEKAGGFGANGNPFFWIGDYKEASRTTHLAFTAKDHAMVDAFYAAAIKAGGTDNGKPGPRDYHPGYYGAFVLDPDGNNVEAVCHKPG